MRDRAALSGVLLLLSVTSVSAAVVTQLEFSDDVFERIEAETVDCPEALASALLAAQIADCATLDSTFAEFKKSLRRALRKGGGHGLAPAGPWTTDGQWKKRAYLQDNMIPLWIAFSEDVGGLIIVRNWSIFECDDPVATVPVSNEEGYVQPKLIRRVEPVARPGPDAFVALNVKIEPDGSVTLLCVVAAIPSGYGYEELAVEAVEAVEEWKYKPGTVDGTPIAVAATVMVRWSTR